MKKRTRNASNFSLHFFAFPASKFAFSHHFFAFLVILISRIARYFWRMLRKQGVEPKEEAKKPGSDQWRPVADSIRTPIPAQINGPKELPREVAISCSGCGFLGTYHFGVMICFQRNAQVGFFGLF
jgi:hypothetical protein